MKSNVFTIFFCLVAILVKAQNNWDANLEVDYKMTDKDGSLLNHVLIKKDSLLYEWMEKSKKSTKKIANDVDLQDKLLNAINNNHVLELKSAKPAPGSVNIMLSRKKGRKTKVIIFPQPIKQGSDEEKFVKEFMEPILTKVFEQELKNYPR